LKPTNKVTAAAGAAAVTTLTVWGLTMAGVSVPGEVQGAITTLLVLAAGYFVPDGSKGDHAAE
jgi:hypothetical protein